MGGTASLSPAPPRRGDLLDQGEMKMNRRRVWSLAVVGLMTFRLGLGIATPASSAAVSASPDDPPAGASAEGVALFESTIAPLFEAHCWKCHGGQEGKLRGGLRLTSRAGLLKGGDLGPAIDLETPSESLLLQAVRREGPEMPPDGRLPEAAIAALTRWVELGAPWSPKVPERGPSPAEETAANPVEARIRQGRDHWSYRPVVRPKVPTPADASWADHPIDAFIAVAREAEGLVPAPPADKTTLIRRLTYDLTGLPPTPEEIDAFLKDDSPHAYETLVDRLLASPAYGEKWGRLWLDLVRYAETNGYERDGDKPHVWRYRDYVIQSFNDDKPYDQFIREQLAGDELWPDSPEAIVATGYYRLGLWDDEPADPLQARFDEFDDLVATTGQVFLGMTLNCARCHDHKIDPILQADYYKMLAFFRDIPPFSESRDTSSKFNTRDISPPEIRKTYEEELERRRVEREAIAREMTALEDQVIKRMPEEDQRASEGLDRPVVLKKLPAFFQGDESSRYDELKRRADQLDRLPTPPRDLALTINHCDPNPPPTHILIRGNPHAVGPVVQPGFPAVLGTPDPVIPPPSEGAKTAGRRRILADWIASPDNPLTARVMVNRLWHGHFGRGLVEMTSDFGDSGPPPSHPELLDWLASEFMSGGWTLKRIHRLILTSKTYRMSSGVDHCSKGLEIDPANTLLWRFNPRRLTAEEIRDAILAVSGTLNPQRGGPSVRPPIPDDVLAGQSMPGNGWKPFSPPDQWGRRSVYVKVKRSLALPILETHDAPDPDSSCSARFVTIVPSQALGMMNGDFVNEQAGYFAQRLLNAHPNDPRAQLALAIRLALGRDPTHQELDDDLAFLRQSIELDGLEPTEALRHYTLMLLNTNEFVFLD